LNTIAAIVIFFGDIPLLSAETPFWPLTFSFWILLARRANNVYADNCKESSMAEKLNAGVQFPEVSLRVGDETLVLPEAKDSGYSIILFYRGHW
jgi:hypothetical protein